LLELFPANIEYDGCGPNVSSNCSESKKGAEFRALLEEQIVLQGLKPRVG
jgi:hypothetical protein